MVLLSVNSCIHSFYQIVNDCVNFTLKTIKAAFGQQMMTGYLSYVLYHRTDFNLVTAWLLTFSSQYTFKVAGDTILHGSRGRSRVLEGGAQG